MGVEYIDRKRFRILDWHKTVNLTRFMVAVVMKINFQWHFFNSDFWFDFRYIEQGKKISILENTCKKKKEKKKKSWCLLMYCIYWAKEFFSNMYIDNIGWAKKNPNFNYYDKEILIVLHCTCYAQFINSSLVLGHYLRHPLRWITVQF